MERRVILLGVNIINQQKLYHVAILQTKNISTNKIWLIDVAIEVASEIQFVYATSVNLPIQIWKKS